MVLCRFALPPLAQVAPDKPHDPRDQGEFYRKMKAMEPLVEARVSVPRLAQFHAGRGERKAPRPRADECVEMKFALRHFGNPSGERDEGAHHGEQSAE